MHALIVNGAVAKYPYTIGQLRKDNPQTSFSKRPSDEVLESWGVFVVAKVERPNVDHTKNVTEGAPVFKDNQWTQVWIITDASAEEILNRKEQKLQMARDNRAAAYAEEADPIFFKAQRGEAELSEWEAKVQEIRNRYPYPEE